MASTRNVNLTRKMLGLPDLKESDVKPYADELIIMPHADTPLELSTVATTMDTFSDIPITQPPKDEIALDNSPNYQTPPPDLGIYQHPAEEMTLDNSPPKPNLPGDRYDADWIKAVMQDDPGRDTASLAEPYSTRKSMASQVDMALAMKRAVEEGIEGQNKERQFSEEVQSKIIRATHQLIVDNGADYRLIDYLLSGFERSRNTITDLNG